NAEVLTLSLFAQNLSTQQIVCIERVGRIILRIWLIKEFQRIRNSIGVYPTYWFPVAFWNRRRGFLDLLEHHLSCRSIWPCGFQCLGCGLWVGTSCLDGHSRSFEKLLELIAVSGNTGIACHNSHPRHDQTI